MCEEDLLFGIFILSLKFDIRR